MQPLGSAALMEAYYERLTSSHDYDLLVEVLTMNETAISTAQLVDGQINIQDSTDIRRTGSVTLLDPDHALNLDTDSPFAGAMFADRMIRVRHAIEVPDWGVVVATPFVGPISKLNRNGATIDLEMQDKTALCLDGVPPMTVPRGMNAVGAIYAILSQRTGETHFRFPAGTRVQLSVPYSVGWSDEASPWLVCQRIARRELGMELSFSCDGAATLRPRLTGAVVEFSDPQLLSPVAGDNDFSAAVNLARVTAGSLEPSVAVAPASHPLSPARLGRNGVPRYLPAYADLDAPDKPERGKRRMTKKQKRKFSQEMDKYHDQVKTVRGRMDATADSVLAAGLPMTADLSWSVTPIYHLDADDPVRVTTDSGSAVVPFSSGSIPLLPTDELGMTIGTLKRVSRPGRLRR
jgi:hypothetical protein